MDGEPYLVCPSTERLRVDAADGSLAQPEALRYLVAQGSSRSSARRASFALGSGRSCGSFETGRR